MPKTAERKMDYAYGQHQHGFFIYDQYATSHKVYNGYNYTIEYSVKADDVRVRGVNLGVKAVIDAGFALPQILFRVGQNNSNIAIKGDANGNREYTVYIGGAAVHHDKKVTSAKKSGIAGGAGAMRGVAHHIYDGTQSWFGNPKLKAMAVCVVIHELGHVMHDVNDEDVHWPSMSPTYQPNVWQAAAQKVSQYAMKSGGELVAEVFAGTLCGKNYDNQVIGAYRALSGAEVANFF